MEEHFLKGKLGEAFVNEIANKAFLRYWCYPNPLDEKGDKKEICDLLILFKDTAVLIFVKNCNFKGDYSRYFRKTIEKDLKQVYGAERKLASIRDGIYIKHPDREIEKVIIPKNIIRIIVHLADEVQFYPLTGLSENGRFINILDKEAFENLTKELDTIADFVKYFQEKDIVFSGTDTIILPKDEESFDSETAIQFFEYSGKPTDESNRQILISGSESDLLAHYLSNGRKFPKELYSNEYNMLSIDIDGKWNKFIKDKQVIAKKKEDKVSYFIDEYVKRELMPNTNPRAIDLAQELLSFNRLERRTLSKSFFEFYEKFKDSGPDGTGRRFAQFNDTGIVFVYYPAWMNSSDIEKLLHLAVDSFYIHSKYKFKKAILFATSTELQEIKSALLLDLKPFSKEDEKIIMDNAKALGWFSQLEKIHTNEQEYPDV